MAIQIDVQSIEAPTIHSSSSRSLANELQQEDERMVQYVERERRGTDKDRMDALARSKLYRSDGFTHSNGNGKGKEREWAVELDVVKGDGSIDKIRNSRATEVEEGSDEEEDDDTEDSDGSSLSTAEGINSFDQSQPSSSRDKESEGLRPAPPPAPPPLSLPAPIPSTSTAPPPLPPSTPPSTLASLPKILQPILKRPSPARLHSSNTSEGQTLSFSPSLPGSLSRSNSAASPSLLTSYVPELPLSNALESPSAASDIPTLSPTLKDSRRTAFPALDRRSTIGDDKEVGAGSGATSSGGHFFDPTATIRSWKSTLTSRRNPDKKRLAALGFEEELQRDYDFHASFGISLCNIGGLPGKHSLQTPSCSILTHHLVNRNRVGRSDGVADRGREYVRCRLAYIRSLHVQSRRRTR